MNNTTEYKELMAFHPGYYVAEMIEDMGISQAEFAVRVGTTAKSISTLVNGQISLSLDMAKKLSAMSGTSVEIWIKLQEEYDKKLIEIEREKELDAQKEIISVIDYSFFTKYANLPSARTSGEKTTNLCKYLMVSDLRVLERQDFLVNYRTGVSNFTSKNVINSQAWLQTAINMSREIATEPYSQDKLKSFLPELRSMTLKRPEEFVPRMQEIFSQCGVAFVLLPHLKNSGINGAVKWINNQRAVLAINTRGAYADKFWFTLFHEIKHIFQQRLKTVFISSIGEDFAVNNAECEEDADRFSSDILIPPDKLKKWNPNKYTTDNEIKTFASSIGIHPGIVAGRLQHERIIPENRCTKMKEKYIFVQQ